MNGSEIFECSHCGKKFFQSEKFESHECEQLKRFKHCQTKQGHNAFFDYQAWLIMASHKKIKKLETFIASKYYNCFIDFQIFIQDKGIPDKKLYMELMCAWKFPPTMWRIKDVYERFINYYDKNIPPLDKAKATIIIFDKLARAFDCEMDKVLDNLLPSEVARLIFERRFSPWLLLCSAKFKNYLHMLPDPSQYVMITNLIDSDEWQKQFQKNKEIVLEIKKLAKEFGL
jgi:hypothetical protein